MSYISVGIGRRPNRLYGIPGSGGFYQGPSSDAIPAECSSKEPVRLAQKADEVLRTLTRERSEKQQQLSENTSAVEEHINRGVLADVSSEVDGKPVSRGKPPVDKREGLKSEIIRLDVTVESAKAELATRCKQAAAAVVQDEQYRDYLRSEVQKLFDMRDELLRRLSDVSEDIKLAAAYSLVSLDKLPTHGIGTNVVSSESQRDKVLSLLLSPPEPTPEPTPIEVKPLGEFTVARVYGSVE